MSKFLILQLRPEDAAADNEFDAFLKKGGLDESEVERVRMEVVGVPDVSVKDYAGIIVGGGASNVSDEEHTKPDFQKRFERDLELLLADILEHDVPYLGACYGFGALVKHRGGIVSKERYGEKVGATLLKKTEAGKSDPLTKDLPDEFKAFAGHKEACQVLPEGATLLLTSDTCPTQMFKMKDNIYATQFHPELDTDGIIVRINVYKHAGYFPPEDAGKLIAEVQREEVFAPETLMRNFVTRYR
jgi:GMP synthase (glutamine-hydrolysing)